MKLISTCLVLMVAVIALPSCKKEVTQVVSQAFSATYTIQPNQWSPVSGGSGYSTTLDVPELTSRFLGDGAVLVYLSFDNGASYEAIPEVFSGITYGTYHGVGYIGIDYSRLDGGSVSLPGAAIRAKVVLLYTDPL
ncbi:MAG: hypothetical protein QM731_16080 [Chitinophagaceae bacterium]